MRICGKRTIPKVPRSKVAAIDPRLVALTVKEPSILRTDSDVEDEVELLVEWCIEATLDPWVFHKSAVCSSDAVEATLLPELVVLGELVVHDLLETGIEEQEQVLLGPLETKSVVGRGKGLAAEESITVCVDVAVVLGVGTPVESRGHEVVTFWVRPCVSAELSNVDFSAAGPFAVNILFRHHP